MTMQRIATTGYLSGSGNVFTFSNIPQGFTHLQVRAILRDTWTGGVNQSLSFQFNGDGGANYSVHRMFGDGSNVSSQGFSSQNAMFQGSIPTSNELSNTFGGIITDITDYSSSNKSKTIRSISGYDANGTGCVMVSSGCWHNTAAITSITVYQTAGNAQHSRIDLYGINSNPIATGA